MLNFFKLPFRGRKTSVNGHGPLSFLATILVKKHLDTPGSSSAEFSRMAENTMRELTAMQREVSDSDPRDSYETMVAALRRIEDDLD